MATTAKPATLSLVLDEDKLMTLVMVLNEAAKAAQADLDTGFHGDPIFDREDIDEALRIVGIANDVRAAADVILEEAGY